MDDRTKNKPMSQASEEWANSILAAFGIKHHRLNKPVADEGSLRDLPPFHWTIETTEGEKLSKSEY